MESTLEQPNGNPDLFHRPAGGLVNPQSTKPQHCPTLKSPVHPKTLVPGLRPRRNWSDDSDSDYDYSDDDDHNDDDDEEEEDDDDDDARREELRAIYKTIGDTMRKTARERMKQFADICENSWKSSFPIPPPLEMLDYPDHFERAWGWDRILPHNCNNRSRYKEYLLAYYTHNLKEVNASGDADKSGLASLAQKCIKMEAHLLFLWSKFVTVFHTEDRKIRHLSHKVTKRAHDMVNALKVEFPAAAVALKCITKEAKLMCGWLMMENTPIDTMLTSNRIRKCALSFMAYKEPEYAVATAAMVGVIKEAEVVRCFLWNLEKESSDLSWSLFIRDSVLQAMLGICYERSAAKDSTGGRTAVECMPNESDGKNFSEKKLVIKDKLEDKSNHKSCFMTDMAEQDSLADTNDTKKNTNNAVETEEVKKGDTMGSSNDEEVVLLSDGSANKICSEKKRVHNDNKQEKRRD